MNETQYQYEGATFDIQYEIDWVDAKESTHAYITSIKHKGTEFMEILPKETIDFFEDELNNLLAWDGFDLPYDHKYREESHP